VRPLLGARAAEARRIHAEGWAQLIGVEIKAEFGGVDPRDVRGCRAAIREAGEKIAGREPYSVHSEPGLRGRGAHHRLSGRAGPPITSIFWNLAFYTGQRRGARWETFDLEQGLWRFRTKSHKPHVLPLSNQVAGIVIEAHLLSSHTPFVCPGPSRTAAIV